MRSSRLVAVALCALPGLVAAFPSCANEAGQALNAFVTGVREQQAGKNADAVVWLTKAINSHALKREDAARALFDRGVAHDAMGNTRSAIADYSAALAINPVFSAALNNRANAFRRAGKFSEAKRDYLAALNGPGAERQYSYYGLGLIAEKEGGADGPRVYFQKALTEDSSFKPAADALETLAHGASPVMPVGAITQSAASKMEAKRPQSTASRPALRPMINEASGAMIQLGAFRDETSALAGWNTIAAASGGALNGLRPVIVTVVLPGRGRFWRLRAAIGEELAAKKLCKRLIELQLSCMQVSS